MRARTRFARPFLALLGAGLVLSACGGAASPSPVASSPSAPASQAPSIAPTPSAPASSAAAAPSLDLSGAAGAIDDLTSYKMDVSINGTLPGAAGLGDKVVISVLADAENEAYQLTMSGIEGLPPSGINVIVIDPDAWVDLGTGTYIKTPGGAATYTSTLQNFNPSALVTTIPPASLASLEKIGDEDKNGVATTHYHGDASTNAELVASLGEDGKVDFWVARDGGYLVSMVVDGMVDANGTPTPLNMAIDLSRLNDPTIEIVAPS